MSEYTELYKNEHFKPVQINDLDKSWTNMWSDTQMVKNSNILDIMLDQTKLDQTMLNQTKLNQNAGDQTMLDQNSVDQTVVEKFTNNEVNVIQNQNEALDQTLTNMKDLYSTDDQKVNYQSAQIDYLITVNSILYYIYFALLIVIGFILVFNLSTVSIYMRALIAALFIIFPFTIGYIEYYIYIAFSYIFAILNGNVYTNGSW
jgi:hypothetical protein